METFSALLDLCEDLASRYFAPHNKKNDAQEPTFDGERVSIIPEVKHALDAFAKADLLATSMDHAVGGWQLPTVVAGAGLTWFHAANVATAGYVLLSLANANLLAKHGTAEQIEQFVKPTLAGRFTGTMCLSEPQAGSSLADITTRAQPQDDGTYRLFGSKMWISGGDHELSENIVHLVLAKITGAPEAARYFYRYELPKTAPQLDLLHSLDRTTLEMRDNWF